VAEATEGPDGALANNAVGVLGVAYLHARRYGDALAAIDRSLAYNRRREGERSYNVASDLNNRGDLLAKMGRIDDAIADGRAAAAMWTEVIGAGAAEVGIAHLNVSVALLRAKRAAEARAEIATSIAVLGKHPDHAAFAMAVAVEGIAIAQAGDRAAARTKLAGAIAKYGPAAPPWLPWARLELGKVELALGDRARARALVEAAHDALRSEKDPLLDEAERVLAELR
jgi:tetratricopeptide (TPR) repeat protein